MRYLGIDFGTKKVGLALSDEAGAMGFPLAVIPNDERLVSTILSLIEERGVEGIVIGESKDFSGEENPVATEARAFGDLLEDETGLSVDYEPEALSTQEARRDIEGGRTEFGHVDARAASLILTSYLSRHGRQD
jgi:putative holliday junction resolvase